MKNWEPNWSECPPTSIGRRTKAWPTVVSLGPLGSVGAQVPR